MRMSATEVPRVLAVDAGNSRIKWGTHDHTGWMHRAACPTADPEAALAALAQRVREDGPSRVAMACVAGPAVREALATGLARLGVGVHVLHSGAAACGVRNGYRSPAQLGVDRWAGLVGARAQHAGPCLVVGAGTATTADVLTSGGLFAGGIILPGLDLMLQSLARGTAALPLADGQYAPLPDNTADAIVTGCLQAQAGAIERQFARIAGEPDALCLLTGGGAGRLLPLLGCPARVVETLVLDGVAALGRALANPPE